MKRLFSILLLAIMILTGAVDAGNQMMAMQKKRKSRNKVSQKSHKTATNNKVTVTNEQETRNPSITAIPEQTSVDSPKQDTSTIEEQTSIQTPTEEIIAENNDSIYNQPSASKTKKVRCPECDIRRAHRSNEQRQRRHDDLRRAS